MRIIIPAQQENDQKSFNELNSAISKIVHEYQSVSKDFIAITRENLTKIEGTVAFKNLVFPNLTRGAMCTVLMAIDEIFEEEEVLIVGANSLLHNELHLAINYFRTKDADAGVISFNSADPKYSYIRVDKLNRISEIAEKRQISNNATVGIFYFANYKLFQLGALWALKHSVNSNGSYFVSHSLHKLILDGHSVLNYTLKNNSNYYHQ